MSEDQGTVVQSDDMLRMVTDIVAAYVGSNAIPAADIPNLIKTVHTSLADAQPERGHDDPASPRPVVPVRRSIQQDHIICLEDGKKLKMLKRYLRTKYNMTPDEYRAKWSLPPDYPMVAPNYSKQRSKFAKKIGLGRRRGNLDL